MDTPEKEKPKRKRKRSAWQRTRLMLLALALILTIGGGLAYWQVSNAPGIPVPTEYFSPSPTPFVLPDQCDLTGNTYRIRADGQFSQERWNDSPDKQYRVRYNSQGIALHDLSTNTLIEQLVAFPYTDTVGGWSPDSRYFAFMKPQMTLAVYDTQTHQPRIVAENVIHLDSWSPDSRWFTFQQNDQIWLTNVDGSQLRAITPVFTGSEYYYVARWSPTSEHLALIANSGDRHALTILPTDS